MFGCVSIRDRAVYPVLPPIHMPLLAVELAHLALFTLSLNLKRHPRIDELTPNNSRPRHNVSLQA